MLNQDPKPAANIDKNKRPSQVRRRSFMIPYLRSGGESNQPVQDLAGPLPKPLGYPTQLARSRDLVRKRTHLQ